MQCFVPMPGVVLFRQLELTANSPSKRDSGLLLPTKEAEETLVRGKIEKVNDASGEFQEGDVIALSSADIDGSINLNGATYHTTSIENILGKVID